MRKWIGILISASLAGSAFGVDVIQDRVYGLKSQSSTAGAGPTNLFRFNVDGTGFTDLGAVKVGGLNVEADGLAYDGFGLYGFAITANGSQFLSIHPTTAIGTTVGTFFGGKQFRAAGITPWNSVLALDVLSSQLWDINTFDASSSLVGTLARSFSTATDLAYRPNGELWITDANEFHRISGLATSLIYTDNDAQAETGAPPSFPGIAFDSSGFSNDVYTYDVLGQDDVFSFQSGSLAGSRALLYSNIIPSFDAGRGDLASRVATVPEPATLVALGLGALALLRRRRVQSR
ncbi:MAG TPA: PEP-CTERM sorting domain-containing protein [Fimbriimonadaceae bacterium]|nr:PEP-CTERM sorting domain-containing protein [Fimbriimonadaceae bacterium]HRJ33533.1 PEP-CTERM sorting domain-containing protein [Fimbriimonadaceae bacterium]